MSAAHPIFARWPAQCPDRLQLFSAPTPNGVKAAIMLEETGLAGNTLFWGGYPARTPSWYATLAKYGLAELDATLFLADNVLLASTDPEPWPSLMAYIAQGTEQSVEWEYYDTIGYVNIFRIYTY